MTADEVVTAHEAGVRRIARAIVNRRAWLREEAESGAMLGLAIAARKIGSGAFQPRDEDHTRNFVHYVARCEILRALGDEARRAESPAPKPYNIDNYQNARIPLAAPAQTVIARGIGGGRMAHLMRWLVAALVLGCAPAWADSTVTWPTKDEGGLTIPTRRTPNPGDKCWDNTLRKCWSAEIINGMAGNLVVDDDPQPGEVHRWTPCFRAGIGYVLAVCWNDCGQGKESKVATNCLGPAKPVAPGVTWP